MRKIIYLMIVGGLIFMFGCGQKNQQANPQENTQFPSQEKILAQQTVESKVISEPQPQAEAVVKTQETEGGAQPSESWARPTDIEIQEALKNAGFYQGEIDGKIGPASKKAIEDFQTQNNLVADGKVGPRTWEKLSVYLNAASSPGARD